MNRDSNRSSVARSPTPLLCEALYKKLWASDSVIRTESVAGLDALPRIAAPITVGTQQLGSIWAIEGAVKLGRDAEHALAEAARVAALHMIHARSSRDIERGIKGDLLRSLLEGRGDINATANRLGVATYSEAFRLQAAAVAIGRTVYCLLPVTKLIRGDRVREVTSKIQEHRTHRGDTDDVSLFRPPDGSEELHRCLDLLDVVKFLDPETTALCRFRGRPQGLIHYID